MGQVEVLDRVIWIKHIHGAQSLSKKLEALPAGSTIRLRVDDVSGLWEKMANHTRSGKPTPGLKSVGPVSAHWQRLFKTRRGELVNIEQDDEASAPFASNADRDAAWAAFVALTRAGWRSTGSYGSREELHDR